MKKKVTLLLTFV